MEHSCTARRVMSLKRRTTLCLVRLRATIANATPSRTCFEGQHLLSYRNESRRFIMRDGTRPWHNHKMTNSYHKREEIYHNAHNHEEKRGYQWRIRTSRDSVTHDFEDTPMRKLNMSIQEQRQRRNQPYCYPYLIAPTT